jgi:hypothetical protein
LVLEEGGTLEALQIFMRPKEKDSKPEVTFYELDNAYSLNKWRLIASPTKDSTLHIHNASKQLTLKKYFTNFVPLLKSQSLLQSDSNIQHN